MMIEDFYKYLNNIDYRREPHEGVLNSMIDNKIVVIQGLSDDILDMYGFASEQFNAWDGFSYKGYKCEKFQKEAFNILEKCEVEMIWCPDKERSWLVKANDICPKKEFNVIEDGEIYCTGLIIDVSNIV